MLDELQQGAQHLKTLFAHLWLPVLVPPWNRLTETLIPELRSFVGESFVLSAFTRQLQQRRLRHINPTEPTGLLTHHWTHDQQAWDFLENFFIMTTHHGVHWLDAHSLFLKR